MVRQASKNPAANAARAHAACCPPDAIIESALAVNAETAVAMQGQQRSLDFSSNPRRNKCPPEAAKSPTRIDSAVGSRNSASRSSAAYKPDPNCGRRSPPTIAELLLQALQIPEKTQDHKESRKQIPVAARVILSSREPRHRAGNKAMRAAAIKKMSLESDRGFRPTARRRITDRSCRSSICFRTP